MFFLYHTLSHRLQPEAPQCVCVCVCVYKYTCLCVSVCVRETRVCLSAFCHPAIGDSFNCSMTTTRKDQKPHKSQSKLAAVPRWKASHAIITGKKTSSTAAQHRVYLTPITQLCRYPNNNALCPDRTRGCLREKNTWTSPVIKECLAASEETEPLSEHESRAAETLILKSSDEFTSASYIVRSRRRGASRGINNSFYKTHFCLQWAGRFKRFDIHIRGCNGRGGGLH